MNLKEVLNEMGQKHQRIKGSGYSDMLYFDHKAKSISSKKLFLVDNGIIIPQKIELTDKILNLEDDWGFEPENSENFYSGIEERFLKYYNSLPSKSDQFIKSIFPFKPMNKYSSFEEMMNVSNNRALARYDLEWFFMVNSIYKNIVWENDNHWFWKSPNTNLIIYKEHINTKRGKN